MKREDVIKLLKYIHLDRIVRTPFSEEFVVWLNEERLGDLHLHYTDVVHATLILEKDLGKAEVQELVSYIDDKISHDGIKRDDFIITVYSGKDIGMFSDKH